MSKRELKAYIKELTKEQLEEQIQDLYVRFKDVKEYYDFAFNPKEKELLEHCRFQISKEYFPLNGRKPKKRRSVAQKWIRKLTLLGVEPSLIGDLMLYNIEIAQTYSNGKSLQETFYRSIFKSFDETLGFINENGIKRDFSLRVGNIVNECIKQKWTNAEAFERLADLYV